MNANEWKELLEKLAEPFPAPCIQWRAGQVTRDKKRAQALPYAEPREYEDRPNALVPGGWSVTFRPWNDKRIICELTICGVTRSSTGEENDGFAPGTAAEAQAFKRACSKFGLGRYLYSIDAPWVAYDAEKRRLLETPRLPAQAQPAPAPAPAPTPTPTKTLPRDRAAKMHAEMGKLGLEREAHYALAERILNREVKSLTAITEEEALLVWNAAKQAGSWRAKEAAAARHLKSDEGSAAVLN